MNLSDYQLKEIEIDLMKTCWFFGRTEDGRIIRYAGTRCGNRVYAAQTEKRLSACIDKFCKMDGTLFSITLTAPYKYSKTSILESWKMVKIQWSVFLQWARRNGFSAYIMSYEAFKNGGCHIHLSIKYKENLNVGSTGMIIRYRLNKKNVPQSFIDSDKFIHRIKRNIIKSWKMGTVKINFSDKGNEEKVVRYACKNIGWGSQVEDALRNAKKGEATADDIKKLWGHYISKKLNYRRWSSSRNLKPALDLIMNNSIKMNDKVTSIDKAPIICNVIIPYSARKSGKIKREFGILESGSDEEKFANDLLEKKSRGNTDINSMVMEASNVDGRT